tara:strand:- start:3578 stop:5368 length:1791 start_codon:yes stop_codon:yes gene_type:complete
MNWTEILKRQTLSDKIVASRKSGNFDEILANHGKSQIRRAVNNLIEDGLPEKAFQPLLDKLGASKKDDDYKNPKEIKLYEDFLAGNHKPLITFLEKGTAKSGAKTSRLLRWDEENGEKIFNYIKDKPELYGYITDGIELQLPLTFETDKLEGLSFVSGSKLTVTLPEFMSPEQAKLLQGGKPDKEIVRTVLGKVFGLDEYKEDDVISSQKLDVSTISDSFAVEYLKMVISSIRGQAREPFMPNLTDFENVKSVNRAMQVIQREFFGAEKSSASTSRIYPALDYILNNDTLNLDVGFVKTQTKQSLQEKQFMQDIRDGLVDNAEIVALYNKFVKTGVSSKYQREKGITPTQTKGYGQFKTAVYNAELGKEYEELVSKTQVRRYTLKTDLRDALVAIMEGSSTKPQQELVRKELGHIFGSRVRRSVKTMRVGDVEFGEPEQILAALKEMEEKAEGTVSITDPQRIPTLQFLFEDIDNDPIGNYLGQVGDTRKKLKDFKVSSKQSLQFSDLLTMLVQLEGYMLGDRNLQISLRKLKKERTSEGIDKFKQELVETYSNIHKELLTRIKEKMSEVMEKPILHNKKGATQPYQWIASEGGRA